MAAKLVSVTLAAPYAGLKYCWRRPESVSDADGAVLGHQAVDVTTPVANLAFGVNYPKPRKATRVRSTGYTSSFVAPSALVTATAAGWDISKAKSKGRKSNTSLQVVVYVTVNGLKYAWGMSRRAWAKVKANAPKFGIREATDADTDLIFGAQFPKPPRVASSITSGRGDSAKSLKVTTFCDPSNLDQIPRGFSIIDGQYTQAAWAEIV